MNVLFICTANSCRSQMAEAWARQLFPAGWEAASAGMLTYPITERTRAAMAEAGVSMEGQISKSIDVLDLDDFDLVVTLSRTASRFLPQLADPRRHVPVPMPDPMAVEGTPQEIARAFAEARERIRDVVEDIVAGRLGPGSSPRRPGPT